MRSLEQYKRDSARLQFTYTCTVDSQLTGFICSLTDSTLSSIATFVLFTARVTPPAKPCLPEPRARPCQDIDRRHRARHLRPGQRGIYARLHTDVKTLFLSYVDYYYS